MPDDFDAARDTGPAMAGPDGAVRIRAGLDSPTYCMFQRLHLTVEIAVAEGFHVYAEPAPDGYAMKRVGHVADLNRIIYLGQHEPGAVGVGHAVPQQRVSLILLLDER